MLYEGGITALWSGIGGMFGRLLPHTVGSAAVCARISSFFSQSLYNRVVLFQDSHVDIIGVLKSTLTQDMYTILTRTQVITFVVMEQLRMILMPGTYDPLDELLVQ